MMRRTILLLAVITLAAAMFVPTSVAGPSGAATRTAAKAASGLWTEGEGTTIVWKETPKGDQYQSGSWPGTWTGTFEGSSVDDWGAEFGPDGTYWVGLQIAFEGTVGDKTGTLDILITGALKEPDGTPKGKWVIISGGADLANLHGQGNWYYDFDAEGVRYEGIVKEFVPPA